MTEAYAIANDQLRKRAEAAEKERDSLNVRLTYATDALNLFGNIYNTPQATDESVPSWCERLRTAAHTARDALRAQLDAVTAERDEYFAFMAFAGRVYERPRGNGETINQWANRLITAIHEDAETSIATKPRIFTDLEMQTGPVAFERNQLRDELAELRPQVDDLRAKLAAAEYRATMHERDADESSRAVSVLSTIIRASVEAIARGVK